MLVERGEQESNIFYCSPQTSIDRYMLNKYNMLKNNYVMNIMECETLCDNGTNPCMSLSRCSRRSQCDTNSSSRSQCLYMCDRNLHSPRDTR